MQVQGQTLFAAAKATNTLGEGARQHTISAERGLQFFEDEFISESEAFRSLDNSPFDRNPQVGQVEVDLGPGMAMKTQFEGTPIGGFMNTVGSDGEKNIAYFMESKDLQVRCLGVTSDTAGNLSHGALLVGDLKTDQFRLETIGDLDAIRGDKTYTRLAQFFLADK